MLGLRVPSESLLLKWSDIDWEHGWFMVTSPKTEHLEGQASRKVPIFPELLAYLQDTFELAEGRSDYCITRYRGRPPISALNSTGSSSVPVLSPGPSCGRTCGVRGRQS